MSKKQKSHAKHPPLQILKQKLHTEGYGSQFISGAEDEGFDYLLIPLDEFEEEEAEAEVQFVLQAFFVEDMMLAETPDLPEEEIPEFAMLQLISEMPFSWESVAQNRYAEGMAILNIFSQKLPFGHFYLDEDTVIYTYAFPSETQKLPVALVTSMLDMISFFVNRMAPVMEAFANNADMSWEDALDALDAKMGE